MRRRAALGAALAFLPFLAARRVSADQTVYIPGGLGADVAYTRGLFVGKHGDDAYDGTTANRPKLTIAAAAVAGAALSPTVGAPVMVVVTDGGIYAEDVTLVPYLNLFAPFATLQGQLAMVGNSRVVLDQLLVGNGEVGVSATTDAANSIEVKRAVATGSGDLFRCNGASAVLIVEWCATAIAEDGTIVGGVSDGHIHYHGGDGYISGTGTVVQRTAAGQTLVDIDHMINLGAGAGTGVKITGGGTVDLRSFHIDLDIGFQLQAAGALCNATVHRADGATNLYKFQGAGGTLNLLAYQTSGSGTGSGTANVKLIPSL